MRINPIFGAGTAGKSLVVTSQRRVNCYYENRADGDKSPIALYGTPGMKLAFAMGGTTAPARGALGTASQLNAVHGNQFIVASSSGAPGFTGTIGTGIGNVSLAVNPTQVLLVDGSQGYLYNGASLLNISGVGGFPAGARTCTFAGGFFVVEVPGSQQFQISASYDGTTWPALSFATISQYPDLLAAVDSYLSNLLLFGTEHTEFWQPISATPVPFAPLLSATVEYGIAAIFSRVHLDNKLFLVGQKAQGGVCVLRISGYQVTPISDPDIEYILNTFPTCSDMVGLGYWADKHPMYQITSPSQGRSFLFDGLSEIWSETQTGTTPAYAQRHVGQWSTNVGSTNLITDSGNANYYTADPNTFTDNGVTIPRRLRTRHQLKDHNVFSVDELYLDAETGVGLVSGVGANPQIQVTCSKNNGRTWGTPRITPLGPLGNYGRMPPLRRWGSARVFDFDLYMTDPVKFAFTSAAMGQREREQT